MPVWISVPKFYTFYYICPFRPKGRAELLRKASDRSVEVFMNNADDITRIIAWIKNEGCIEQFQLVRNLEDTLKKTRRMKDKNTGIR